MAGLMRIWGFEAAIDRSYPVALAGVANRASVGFRSFLSRNLDRFRVQELAGTFVPTTDYFCNPRAVLLVAPVE
jgi:hypothetical protein